MPEQILLVDDEEDIRLVLGIALRDLGYDVLTAENGASGLDLFVAHHPPIVITDIKMPDIDGIDLLKKIKDHDPDTEVVMITGHGDMDMAVKSFQFEATDFITKPIDVGSLEKSLTRVREKIFTREKLRDYTQALESLVWEKNRKLGEIMNSLSTGEGDRPGTLGLFQSLFEDLPGYVAVVGRDLTLLIQNKRFRDDFGDRTGVPCYEVFKQKGSHCSGCRIEETLSSGKSEQWRTTIMDSDGASRDVLVWSVASGWSESEPGQALVLVIDISQALEVRDHLSSLGLLTSAISHNIKGMLTNLDGGLYLLDSGLKKDKPVQVEEGLKLIRLMVGRIRNAILDVLLFSKERDLCPESLDIKTFVEDGTRPHQAKAEAADIDLVVSCPLDLGFFEVDPVFMRTALNNILDNAFDACRADRTKTRHQVRVRAKADPDRVTLIVEDNGCGMDPETRAKVFDLFYSTKGSQGTGLGLYLTERAIRQHAGRIELESEAGSGCRFTMVIPRKFNPKIQENRDRRTCSGHPGKEGPHAQKNPCVG